KNIIFQNSSNPFETIKMPYINHPKIKGRQIVKRSVNDLVPPPHKGLNLFSQDDYNKIVGLTMNPSNEDPQEVKENFEAHIAATSESESVLDRLHEDEVQEPSSNI